MKIYWCHEADEYYGLFVLAHSRGRAKDYFAAEVGCDFIDVRSRIMKRGVSEVGEGILFDNECDGAILEKYGLHYEEEEK